MKKVIIIPKYKYLDRSKSLQMGIQLLWEINRFVD